MKLEEVAPALREMVESQEWRLNNLYWIEDKKGRLQRFRMNFAQRELFENFHHRNEILKARQLGISTFVAILMLDCCLFTARWTCGIVDKAVDEAKKKLSKALLAYDLLDYVPENASAADKALAQIGKEIKRKITIEEVSKTAVKWGNRSSITVGASMRGGTLQMLHVSELAYVANHNPKRAQEIRTGALNAVAAENYIVKESTHEGGRAGINYEMVQQAMANCSRKKISQLDYRFFFFPWFKNPEYEQEAEFWDRLPDPEESDYKIAIQERKRLEDYFAELAKLGIVLNSRQKAWYQSQQRTFGFMVRQEYPSTPDEAFDVLAQRAIYQTELTMLKVAGRILVEFETNAMLPTYVSWDIGRGDAMSIWLWQVGPDGTYHVVDHYSANRMSLDHFVGVVRAWEGQHQVSITKHLVPHDARHEKWDGDSFEQSLRRAGFAVSVVPRTRDVWVGIQATRLMLPHCVFHSRCSMPITASNGKEYPSGIQALENYQTAPEGSNGVERTQPLHDRYSHSADAFRTFAEACAAGLVDMNASWAQPYEHQGGCNVAVGARWLYE